MIQLNNDIGLGLKWKKPNIETFWSFFQQNVESLIELWNSTATSKRFWPIVFETTGIIDPLLAIINSHTYLEMKHD